MVCTNLLSKKRKHFIQKTLDCFTLSLSGRVHRSGQVSWITHTHAQKSRLTLPHSSRVRTFVLAGPQKNADKADIIFGLLRGLRMCVHVQMYVCAATRKRVCVHANVHGQIHWRRLWHFRRLSHCEIGAEITKLRLERTQSGAPTLFRQIVVVTGAVVLADRSNCQQRLRNS